MMLCEIIEQLNRLYIDKHEYSIRALRDAIQDLADKLQKIADSLII